MENEIIIPIGSVEMIIETIDGDKKTSYFKNSVLNLGKNALASCLANNIGDSFNFYINRMIFGDGGTTSGVPNYVNTNRNGLFGTTRASKGLIATIDPNNGSQITFTSILAYTDAVGYTLNEMALRMNNGDLYSMVTFPDLNKTAAMQICFNWKINFL